MIIRTEAFCILSELSCIEKKIAEIESIIEDYQLEISMEELLCRLVKEHLF